MLKVRAKANSLKNGFNFSSDHSKNLLLSWMKKWDDFYIMPIIKESPKNRRYVEGALIPAYCEWQYGINARDYGKDEQRRFLFKRDFNYEIVKDRKGDPIRSPISSKGLAKELSNRYTEWATENGAPIPNAELYKLWRDQYSLDDRFPMYFLFLDFLEIECDAMPSSQHLEKLVIKTKTK